MVCVWALALLGKPRDPPDDGLVLVLVLGNARRSLHQLLRLGLQGAQKSLNSLDLYKGGLISYFQKSSSFQVEFYGFTKFSNQLPFQLSCVLTWQSPSWCQGWCCLLPTGTGKGGPFPCGIGRSSTLAEGFAWPHPRRGPTEANQIRLQLTVKSFNGAQLLVIYLAKCFGVMVWNHHVCPYLYFLTGDNEHASCLHWKLASSWWPNPEPHYLQITCIWWSEPVNIKIKNWWNADE